MDHAELSPSKADVGRKFETRAPGGALSQTRLTPPTDR